MCRWTRGAAYGPVRQATQVSNHKPGVLIYSINFRICKALVTNFHQPGSTLLLLVAAMIGEDWKRVYKEALANEYRFLSYGDSSLLFAKP